MSLATLNNNYFIPYATIVASRPNYKFEVQAKVDEYLKIWLRPRNYINLADRTPIGANDMAALSNLIQNENNYFVKLSTNINSQLYQFFKGNTNNIKNYIISNDTRFTWPAANMGNQTMMWYLAQSQIIADAAAIINTKLSAKTSYRVG